AIANMRPSCPLPKTPKVAPGRIGFVMAAIPPELGHADVSGSHAASSVNQVFLATRYEWPATPRFSLRLPQWQGSRPEYRLAFERSKAANPAHSMLCFAREHQGRAAQYAKRPYPADARRHQHPR